MRRPLLLLVLLAIVVALASCGGDDGAETRPAQPPPSSSAEQVVEEWSADMRRGDIDAAASRFAVPAIVANGTPQVTLDTREEVRTFNETLPCGSRVTATERHYGLVIATFELTDRPGGDCGAGTGAVARAAFEIRDGKIVRWLRVGEGGAPEAPPGPVV